MPETIREIIRESHTSIYSLLYLWQGGDLGLIDHYNQLHEGAFWMNHGF
jgi:hypothetical protein